MKVYAIRHKPSKTYMPSRMFKGAGSGWSHWAPGLPADDHNRYDGYDKNPRIFFTWRSARNALTAWLQGPWERITGTEGDWETGYYTIDLEPAPMNLNSKDARELKDMEIIELELVGL